MNTHYKEIGNSFVENYYRVFDDSTKRSDVVNFYNPTECMMTFEGEQIQGTAKILEKIQTFAVQKITRVISTIDSQPTHDRGVLITVTGRLQCDQEAAVSFSQIFILKPNENANYFLTHDVFRLIANTPA